MTANVVTTWAALADAPRGAILGCEAFGVKDVIASLAARCPGCGEMTTIDVEDEFKLTGFPGAPTLDGPVHHSCGWSGKLINGEWQ